MSGPGDTPQQRRVIPTPRLRGAADGARAAGGAAAPRRARARGRPGTTATRPRGQGHEIREIRPFADGDDPRHLDAAATARTGALQVRSFHEDRDRTLMLIADFRRPMLWGTARLRSVAMAEALAVAGWQAVSDGGAAGVAVLTDAGILWEKPASRSRGMARVAGCLALGHARALEALGHRAARPSLLISSARRGSRRAARRCSSPPALTTAGTASPPPSTASGGADPCGCCCPSIPSRRPARREQPALPD